MNTIIPEAKQSAVARALDETFGVREFDEIRPLTGGLSNALVFRIVVRGHPYMLRLSIGPALSGDPARAFASMQVAAEAGLAPHIWYANVEEGVLITDFVDARAYPTDMGIRVSRTLHRVHSLRGFPSTVNYFDAMDRFVRAFRDANLLPSHDTDDLFRRYDDLMTIYPRNGSDRVTCQNDLKPQNVLLVGQVQP